MKFFQPVLVFLLSVSTLQAATTNPVASVTNRLAEIIATSNYTFTITFGNQGILTMDGYTTPTSQAFCVRREGREILRSVDHEVWLPSTGTGGAARVRFDFTMHVQIGYGAEGNAILGFGLMPPTRPLPFLMTFYGGLAGRAATLGRTNQQGDLWRFCETNETGTCIEIRERAAPAAADISLLRTETDKSSVFIHELRIAGGTTTKPLSLPAAPRTVSATNYIVAQTFVARVAAATLHSAGDEKIAAELFTKFGIAVDRCEAGTDNLFPGLPRVALPPGARWGSTNIIRLPPKTK